MAKRGRSEGVRRVLALHHRLARCRYCPSIVELAKEFGVTARTIYRDLDLLQEVGYPVPRRYKDDRVNAAGGQED